MDNINERFKEIRISMGKNQTDFATLLGFAQSGIAMIESGKRGITDRHIKTICSICNINEHWLRTGEGSMEAQNQTSTVVDLLQKSFESLDDYDKQVIASWIQATPEDRAAIKRFLNCLKSLQDADPEKSCAFKKIRRIRKLSKMLK